MSEGLKLRYKEEGVSKELEQVIILLLKDLRKFVNELRESHRKECL